jgi:hypothetical protein
MVLVSLVSLFLVVGSDGVQPGAGPVRLFGGTCQDDETVFVLDVGGPADPSRLLRVSLRQPGAISEIVLEKTPKPLDPYGLAHSNDGSLWILTDKGRSVARFATGTGKLLRLDPLPGACAGIWSFGSRILLAPMQVRGGEHLLAVEEGGQFRPFSRLKGRTGSSTPETLAINLFECGAARFGRLPCWWMSGASEVVLIAKDEEVRVLPAPSLIDTRLQEAARTRTRSVESLLASLLHPILDVFLLSADSFWLLTNQEGDKLFSDPGSIHARHVLRVDAGKVTRTLELPKAGRSILGADDGGVLMLFAASADVLVPLARERAENLLPRCLHPGCGNRDRD